MIASGTVLLLEEAGPSHDNPHRWYTPQSGLYRSFAELEGSPDAILTFADRYGVLGGQGDLIFDPMGAWHAYQAAMDEWLNGVTWDAEGTQCRAADAPQPPLPQGPMETLREETLDGWQMEICAMRMCVDLYEALTGPSPAYRLRRHFSQLHEPLYADFERVFHYDTEPDMSKRVTALWRTEVSLDDEHRGNPADPDDPGFYYHYVFRTYRLGKPMGFYEIRGLYVHERSETVVDFARIMLMATINAHLEGRVNTTLLTDPREGRTVLFTMPTSLIGELWLQLARTIDGDRQFRQCRVCRGWFELSPDTARADKAYCSQACRSRAYRRRLRARGGCDAGGPSAGGT